MSDKGYWKKAKDGGELSNMSDKQTYQRETVEDILTYQFRGNKKRRVTKATCERFGVRASVSELDGSTITAYYFPSYNQKGEITGYMKQDVTKPKEVDGHWTAIGAVKIGNKLFGQDVVDQVKRKHTNIVVTEGQWDCLSVYQSQLHSVSDTKYAGQEPFVVSIPLGTKNATEALLHNKSLIDSFESMTVFFDDDHATPEELKKGVLKGKEAKEAVAAAFIGSIPLYTVQTKHGFKDASDYLQNENSTFSNDDQAMTELAKLVQFDRIPMVTEKIAQVSDVDFEDVITPIPQGINITSYPKLNDMLYTWRTGELTVVTARSGAGKTTCMTKVAEDAIDQQERLGLIYLEEKITQTLQRFVASKLKVSFKKFKRNPLSVASREDAKRAYDELKDNKQIVFLDHFGSLPITELMAKVKHLYFVEGCRYILLDHLSMVMSGSVVADERKEIDIVMTELAAFCAANDVAIMLVVHLNRQGSAIPPPPKGKEDEPYWVTVNKETMKGSGSLEQIAWNVLGIEQEINPDRSRGRVRWVVLKNREGGDVGVADTFTINQNTWEVTLFDDDKYSSNMVSDHTGDEDLPF